MTGRSFDLSRNPSDYEPTAHLRRRIDERTMVDYDIIGEVIEDGDVEEVRSESNEAVLHYDWLNSTFRVVVDYDTSRVETAFEIEA